MFGGENEAGAAAGPAPSSVRRKRTPRVTSGQIDALLVNLEARPYLHNRKFTGLQGRENFDAGWKEVAAELNQLPNGSIKTPEQWMTVWRDFKSRACSKAARLRKERVQTGNRAVTTAPLTEVERRIVSLIGVEYTLGTECPDAMPEEDMIQHEMEVGVSTSEVISLPQSQYSEIDFVDMEYLVPLDDAVAPSGRVINVVTSPSPPPPLPEPQVAPNVQRERSTRNRNLNPRRSVDDQYRSARQDFLAIAESNAESMRMLAAAAKLQGEAAKTQAEASVMFANAADKIAEAAKMQAETSRDMAKTADKIAEALIKIIQ